MEKLHLFKKLFNFVVALFCGVFVVLQTLRCIDRYMSCPKASEIKISNGIHELFPEFTICQLIENSSIPFFRRSELENCGLNESDYKLNHKWYGNCENAKSLYENISIKIEDLINSVTVERRFLKNDIKYPADLQFWNIIDDPR